MEGPGFIPAENERSWVLLRLAPIHPRNPRLTMLAFVLGLRVLLPRIAPFLIANRGD